MAAVSVTNFPHRHGLGIGRYLYNSHSKALGSLKPFSFIPMVVQRSFSVKLKLQLETNLSIPTKPSSQASSISCSLTTHKEVSNLFAQNVVKLLIGSFIFMGCFRAKPVIAQSVQETISDHKDEDEDIYLKLFEQDPRNMEALKMIVNAKMRAGKTKEAVEYVEKLIEIQPKEVEWRLLRALCYEIMGEFGQAKRLFKEILRQRPLLVRALHGLAMVMHKNHEGPAVFEMLNSALEVAREGKRVTEERNIRILIAQMHIVKGELEEALEKFQHLVNENPRDFRPYLCQGIIYSLLDKKKDAEEQFDIYRRLVPEEFPQKGFLNDVVLAAKTQSAKEIEEELQV